MNHFPFTKRTQIIALLDEGMSMRQVFFVADLSISTVKMQLHEVVLPAPRTKIRACAAPMQSACSAIKFGLSATVKSAT